MTGIGAVGSPSHFGLTGIPLRYITWIGIASDRLFAVLSDGATYRLDRVERPGETAQRMWVLVATLPLVP